MKTHDTVKRQKLDELVAKIGVVPNRLYGHLLFTVGRIVDTGKQEVKARAGQGLEKVMTGLKIPRASELNRLKDRIARIEKRLGAR